MLHQGLCTCGNQGYKKKNKPYCTSHLQIASFVCADWHPFMVALNFTQCPTDALPKNNFLANKLTTVPSK